jgi:CubicO group peptidase (beta-lactamase class C family)
MKRSRLEVCCALLWLTGCGSAGPSEPVEIRYDEGLSGFAARLDSLRVGLRIPGLSAAVARDGAVEWAQGFGLAEAERGRRTTSHTPFHLASLTKPFAPRC